MKLDRLYASFVARDLFAKVVPGGILLLTIAWSVGDAGLGGVGTVAGSIPGWGWPFVYGACYVLGFAIQAVGELFGILSQHPMDETGGDFLGRLIQFEREVENENLRTGRERLVVIKEMSGNVAVSIFLATMIWLWVMVRDSGIYLVDIAATLPVLIFMVGLYWFHYCLRWRQREYERTVLAENNAGNNVQDYPIFWRFLITMVIMALCYSVILFAT